jgi:hypothetical protein
MKERSRRAWWSAPELRWGLWLACVVVSTALLVGPSLALALRRQIDTGENPSLDFNFFLLSKLFHVSDYALMAVLTAWLPAPRRLRGLLLLFLSAHAMGTEFIQLFVATRTGTLHDIGLDHVGIALGLALTWKWWRQPEVALTPEKVGV